MKAGKLISKAWDWSMNNKGKALVIAGGTACAAAAGVLGGLWAYGLKYNLTEEDKALHLPGDELMRDVEDCIHIGEAIDIDATPEQVWPYLAQMGTRKAGWYSFSWLERFFTFHIYNTFSIVPEWQDIKPGDYLLYHQCGIGSEVKSVKINEHIATISDTRKPSEYPGAIPFTLPIGLDHFAWTWNFNLVEKPDGTTRLITTADVSFAPDNGWRKAVVTMALGTPSFVMIRAFLETIKGLAEGKINPEGYVNSFLRFITQWS